MPSQASTNLRPLLCFPSASTVAPAGSYMDKGVGKVCQRGTYSTALNSATTCETCPPGITTADEGSTSADACNLAMKGFYINPSNASEAIACPLDHYQDQEATVTACTACPNGWKTKETGATGVALCLAPPGFELKDGATSITACEKGSYKADWNRNPCVPVSCLACWRCVRQVACSSSSSSSSSSNTSVASLSVNSLIPHIHREGTAVAIGSAAAFACQQQHCTMLSTPVHQSLCLMLIPAAAAAAAAAAFVPCHPLCCACSAALASSPRRLVQCPRMPVSCPVAGA
jgi:hypothetical protein